MASIVLTAAGQAIAPGIGGAVLGALGHIAGSTIDREIFGFGAARREGPRLENLKVQDSRYGAGIPIAYGRVRLAGNVIWSTDLIETRREENAGGGKGGGGSVTTARYTYSVNCAVSLCAGPVAALHAVWADGKQVYDGFNWKPGLAASATFYTGTASQNPDATMEGVLGAGNVPAYRGLAYIVFEGLQLADFGNRLPNLTFEMSANAPAAAPAYLGEAAIALSATMDPLRSLQGAPLLPLAGDSARVRALMAAGIKTPGASAKFEVARYDVTTDTPIETGRAASSSFTTASVIGDHGWARGPDARTVALFAQNDGASAATLMLYDQATATFGPPFSASLMTAPKSIAWLDPLHFIAGETGGGIYGIRLFARAGLSIIDRGFFGIWGESSAATRFPVGRAQFVPIAGGLLMLAGDAPSSPGTLYACHLCMAGGAPVAGMPYTLTASVPATSESHTNLLALGDGEYVLAFSRTQTIRLFSFRAGAAVSVQTRPWQTITPGGVSTTNAPVLLNAGRILVLQRYGVENNYRLADIAINAGDFSMTGGAGAIVAGQGGPAAYYGLLRLDADRIALQTGDIGTALAAHIGIIERQPPGDTLQAIVGDIMARAGYAPAEGDLAALAAERLEGYVLTPPVTARQGIEPLRGYAPFDLIESADTLKARPRGGGLDETVSATELRAAMDGEEPPPALTLTRAQELDLPREVTVEHLDPARDFEIGAQRARRTAGRAKAAHKISLPVVCRADKAKQAAERSLFAAWAERDRVVLRLSRRYGTLEPGDVIETGGEKIRLTRVRQGRGLIEAEGLAIHADAYASAATADGGAGGPRRDVAVMPSTPYLMDLPLLQREHDQPGLYAALSGLDGWPGGTLWRAADGLNFTQITAATTPAAAGIAATALASASFAATAAMDRTSTLTVQLLQGMLASCGESELLNGANAAVAGEEIIQFQTAALAGPGCYVLSNLLRGRRGTEWATGGHAAGERFVLLAAGAVQFLPALAADRGRLYQFRALSLGQALADAPDTELTYGLKTLEPLAPVHVTGARAGGAGTDLTLTWKRRARRDAEWLDLIDAPLDEDAELYDVEIMDGAAVKRAFIDVTSPAQVYTAAAQAADWTVVPATFTVRVYQLSARYGRGRMAEAVV